MYQFFCVFFFFIFWVGGGTIFPGSRFIKGRFLEFRRYHNFANLNSKLSESTFYKEILKFQ